jgi:hypothetical protein
MGFYDSLQKQGLFTDQNPNPLRPPVESNFDPISAFKNLFPLIQDEHEKDRQLKLRLAGMVGPGGQQQMANVRAFQPQPPVLKQQPGETPNVVFKPTGVPEQFVSDIMNPPERGFKFQELQQKNDLAQRGLDIKSGNQDILARRADTSQYSAETRRKLADLKDMTDSEKLEALQTGRYTLEEMKAAAQMANTKERGAQSLAGIKERGSQNIKAIDERGTQNRKTNSEKPVTAPSANQDRIGGNNEARKLVNTQPELGKYISFDEQGNFKIDPNTPLNELSIIKGNLYPKGDIKLSNDSGAPASKSGVSREQAIKMLQDNKLPINEVNIKKAQDPANHK